MRDAVRCAACSALLVMLSTGLPVPPRSAATIPAGINAATSPAAPHPMMLWGDTSRLGRPFSKDPSVIRFRGDTCSTTRCRASGTDARTTDGASASPRAGPLRLDEGRRVPRSRPGRRTGHRGAAGAGGRRPRTPLLPGLRAPAGRRDLPCGVRGRPALRAGRDEPDLPPERDVESDGPLMRKWFGSVAGGSSTQRRGIPDEGPDAGRSRLRRRLRARLPGGCWRTGPS